MKQRKLGNTDIDVSSVAMGCWPIAGMTSLDVNDDDSLATLTAALDVGVNFFDTAYCYGRNGESERLLARAFAGRRDQAVIATKGGIHWDDQGERGIDGRPATLRQELEVSLQRLETDRVELLYLHAPDPTISITESAGALKRLLDEGKTLSVGVSNVDLTQLRAFVSECPVAAIQPPYNMLQRQIEDELLSWCLKNDISAVVYWPLMKGLLAGKLTRDHVFDPKDGRAKYPMFQGQEWQRNQDLIAELQQIAAGLGRPLAEVVVNWTIAQTGITSALCGAKRPYQIQESAAAMNWVLSETDLAAIDAALQRRGVPVTKSAV